MPKLRVHNFTVSVDGDGAGPNQSFGEMCRSASAVRSCTSGRS